MVSLATPVCGSWCAFNVLLAVRGSLLAARGLEESFLVHLVELLHGQQAHHRVRCAARVVHQVPAPERQRSLLGEDDLMGEHDFVIISLLSDYFSFWLLKFSKNGKMREAKKNESSAQGGERER